jgi:hypothetical protein
MRNQQDTEPSSYLRAPLFMIGQNSHGNWVVQNLSGTRGGLFIDRAAALRFARFENGNRPHAYVAVSGDFELDMNQGPGVASPRRANAQRARRVA